jgi:hypothetical protein
MLLSIFNEEWFAFCALPVAGFGAFLFAPKASNMSSQTFANLMQGAVGVGTLLLALAALGALKTWRQEKYYELGTNLLASISDMRARIRFYRLYATGNLTERPKLREQIFVSGKDVEQQFHLAIAAWGNDVYEYKKRFANVISRFSLDSARFEQYSSGGLRDIPATAIKKFERVAILDPYSSEDVDEFSEEIRKVIDDIEAFVRKKMKGE